MSEFKILKLQFTAPLHIANEKPGDYLNSQYTLFSDVFWAAVYNTWAILGKEILIETYVNNAVASSSFMPFVTVTSGKPVYFFPKPLKLSKVTNSDDSLRKPLKKLAFYDLEYYQAWLQGINIPITKECIQYKYLSKQTVLNSNFTDFIQSSIIPRISKGTKEGDPEIFYTQRLYFSENAGLYAIFTDLSSKEQAELELALNYLKDAGIGTDRNVGNGQFNYTWDTIQIKLPSNGNFICNLGLFSPSNKEQLEILIGKEGRYDIIKRGGWLNEPNTSFRKKSVYMFTNSCVFHSPSSDNNKAIILGKTVNLKPNLPQIEHPVYRVGKTIFLPVQIN